MTVCRFCLGNKPRKNITDLKLSIEDYVIDYAEIIMFCLGSRVDEDSKVSTKLCVKCFRQTIAFYQFKSQALKNESFLKSRDPFFVPLGSIHKVLTNEIKTELVTIDIEDDIDNGFESDSRYNEIEVEIKNEPKDEASDDEFLSVLKDIKYEYVEEKENDHSQSNNMPIKKRKGRPKQLKAIKIKIPKSKAELKCGPFKVCEICGKYVRGMKAHKLTHLPLDERSKMFQCDICEKSFSSKPSMKKHLKRKHCDNKKECPVCKKMIINMTEHLKRHNPEQLQFPCVSCGFRFPTRSQLKQHISIHTKDRPFECNICQAKFRLKLMLDSHKRRVHDKEKSHMCQYCSKSFFKKYHLQIHLRSHTKEKPHSCDICGKYFSSISVLNSHKLIHTDEKNHACTLCDMTFVKREYVTAHMKSHIKDKKFPCQYCGVRFHRSDHRKRHEFTAHLKHSSLPTTSTSPLVVDPLTKADRDKLMEAR